MGEKGIDLRRLVHVLKPFDKTNNDWAPLLAHPRNKYQWNEESITGELLRQKLLKRDLDTLGSTEETVPCTSWTGLCLSKDHSVRQKKHLLVAFALCMQPGVFSIDTIELTGGSPDLLKGEEAVYGRLPHQLRTSQSFANELRSLLEIRREYSLEKGELVSVLPSPHKGAFLLLFKKPKSFATYLLALNFGSEPLEQLIEREEWSDTTAINLQTKQQEMKEADSSRFALTLNSWSGKIIHFHLK